jgi:hypothetical protein
MFAPLMAPTRSMRVAAGAACAAVVLGASGCGGGSARPDGDEPAGSYRVDVVGASFPARQAIADRATMRVRVRNADSRTVPNVAVTVRTHAKQPGGTPSAFGQAVDDPRLADPERPVWIVDRAPAAGGTADAGTWALGALPPGRTRTFEWRLTAVQPGRYTVGYEVSAGLGGRARLAAGSKGAGTFRVRIGDEPPESRVGDDGRVIRETPTPDAAR